MDDSLWVYFALGAVPIYLGVYWLACRWMRLRDHAKSSNGNSIVSDKARSWIITGLAALFVTVGSLPFAADFLRYGLDATAVARRPALAQAVLGSFISYLFCDIGVGIVCYRSQVAWLTGWGHHVTYIGILIYVAVHGWSHLFALAAIEELPTALLAAGVLFPTLRSDYLFAASFAMLRLVFHVALMASLATPTGQTAACANGSASLVPALFFAPGLPLHMFWFYGCVKGILRRRTKARQPKTLITLPEQRPREITLAGPTEPVIEVAAQASPKHKQLSIPIAFLRSRSRKGPKRSFGSPLSPNLALDINDMSRYR